MRSSDLAVCAITCPTRRGLDDPADLEPRLDQIRQTMALAFDLGPRLVIIQAGRIPTSPLPPKVEPGKLQIPDALSLESAILLGTAPNGKTDASAAPTPEERRANLMKESLEALGKHGDRVGVTIALDTGLDAPVTLAAYLDRFDCGSLAVNYNPANLVISGHNPSEAITTLHRRIVHIHAQDARRISPNRMATVPLGHGDLDWLHLAATLEGIEYRGYLTVPGDDRAELAAGVAFLRRFVA